MSIFFISTGLFIRFWAIHNLKKNFSWRVKASNEVIDFGVYRFVRHPMYLGALFLYFGAFLYVTHDWRISILMNVFTINFIIDRIDREEQIMVYKFGQKYLDYMKRTKIIIPFIW